MKALFIIVLLAILLVLAGIAHGQTTLTLTANTAWSTLAPASSNSINLGAYTLTLDGSNSVYTAQGISATSGSIAFSNTAAPFNLNVASITPGSNALIVTPSASAYMVTVSSFVLGSTSANTGYAFDVATGGTLNLVLAGSKNVNVQGSSGGAVAIANSGSLNVSLSGATGNMSLKGSGSSSGIWNYSGATVTLTGSQSSYGLLTVQGASSGTAAGIYNESPSKGVFCNYLTLASGVGPAIQNVTLPLARTSINSCNFIWYTGNIFPLAGYPPYSLTQSGNNTILIQQANSGNNVTIPFAATLMGPWPVTNNTTGTCTSIGPWKVTGPNAQGVYNVGPFPVH